MPDVTSSANASLPPWVHDFARRLAPPTLTATTLTPSQSQPDVVIATEAELEQYVWATFGVRIPKVRVCPNHQAPWEAFCAGYFATQEQSVIVIKGSRGLAGKSWLVALLGTVIATTLRGEVTILGGSSAQSNRVHRAMAKFWAAPNAPRDLLVGSPGITRTEFKAGQVVEALTASQKSARGPHPLCLILDEVDEMDWQLYEAAQGQTMDANGFTGRTVISSTHQHAQGTMTEILALAAERGWRVFTWCFKETMEPHGWLAPAQVARKRGEMTAEMWRIEVELGEPSIEDRAIFTEKVERMFIGESIDGDGVEFAYREFELPVEGAHYATGADWARTRDFVEIVTLRDDVTPMRLVAYQRFRRRITNYIVEQFDHQVERYPGNALHDSTSLGGKIMDDLVATDDWGAQSMVTGFDFGKHRARQQMFTDYIIAIEAEEIVSPRIRVLYDQHKYVRNEDLRPSGAGHPPDGFVAGAMARQASGASTNELRLRTMTGGAMPATKTDGGLTRLDAFLAGKVTKGNGDGGISR